MSRSRAARPRLASVFWQGALTNVLNPKVALFFLAFLPQFVDGASEHKTLAFLLLGAVFIFNGTLWCLAIAAFAAKAATRIRQSEGAIAWINRVLGGLFVYLGIRVAMLEASNAHDPDPQGRVSAKWKPVFPATNAKRLRGDHAPNKVLNRGA